MSHTSTFQTKQTRFGPGASVTVNIEVHSENYDERFLTSLDKVLDLVSETMTQVEEITTKSLVALGMATETDH